MISVTADTNIYISAFVFAGVPRNFINRALAGRFRLAISEPIVNELSGVLREKFAWSDLQITEMRASLADCTTLVHPTQTLNVVPDDPDDNRVVECAVTAGSRFIVTGDGDLLRLSHYNGIQILKVMDFLKIMGEPNL